MMIFVLLCIFYLKLSQVILLDYLVLLLQEEVGSGADSSDDGSGGDPAALGIARAAAAARLLVLCDQFIKMIANPLENHVVFVGDDSLLGFDGGEEVSTEVLELFSRKLGSNLFETSHGLFGGKSFDSGVDVSGGNTSLFSSFNTLEEGLHFTTTLLVESLPEGNGAFGVGGINAGLLDNTVEGNPFGDSFFGEVVTEHVLESLDDDTADNFVLSVEGTIEDVAETQLSKGFDGLGHIIEDGKSSGDEALEVHGLDSSVDLVEVSFLEDGGSFEEVLVEESTEGLGVVFFTDLQNLGPRSLAKREREFFLFSGHFETLKLFKF